MRPVIVFDGVCNLCNTLVDFVLRRDRRKAFLFASNQSEEGRDLLARHGADPSDVTTLYLIEDGRAFARSTAALRVARRLKFPWNLAYGLIVVPRPVRDWAYRLIARNRYRLFGKSEICRLPTPEERERFLDGKGPTPPAEGPSDSKADEAVTSPP